MDYMDFLEVEHPCSRVRRPEGARDFLVPSRIHHWHFSMPAAIASDFNTSTDCRDVQILSDREVFSG